MLSFIDGFAYLFSGEEVDSVLWDLGFEPDGAPGHVWERWSRPGAVAIVERMPGEVYELRFIEAVEPRD